MSLPSAASGAVYGFPQALGVLQVEVMAPLATHVVRHYMGLGGKPVFVDLTRIGLVTRQHQFGLPGSGRVPEPMLMVLVPWAYAHGTGTMSICSWYWYHEHMLMVPLP